MELSTKGRYAVMAMVDLAAQGAGVGASGPSVRLAEIAIRQEISQSYLEQLFARLRRAGLVQATRGPVGGYLLARPPRETFISDIMRAVEEPLKVTRCDAHVRSGCLLGNKRCLTHDLWDELSQHIHNFLGAITLTDIIERKVLGKASDQAGFAAKAAQ